MNIKSIHVFFLGLIVFLLLLVIVFVPVKRNEPDESTNEIKYVAIGDSYTIGLGIGEEGRWPNVLTNHLKERGVKINLVANPSVSGYTVRDAIELELPTVRDIKPDLVTVLIGANDSFARVSQDQYRSDLVELLDKLQPLLSDPNNVILVTIPDYSKAPSVQQNATTEGLSDFIQSYNKVIKEEGSKRDLQVADIFPISQTMMGPEDYTEDGLHPSAQGYAKWENVIFPVVFDFLRSSK